ncbi:MAG TPA: AAA family ATPase [Candidatus Binataceae bacterium]|nr:AAA family ATPase [Candidatus Binataceae bacterium]
MTANLEDSYLPAKVAAARDYFVVISGCSGGGKSSLMHELAARGYRVFAEPGRQVVKEQNFIGGDGIPSKDTRKFVELCISRTMHNMIIAANTTSYVFFDRSIVDNINGLMRMPGGAPAYMLTALEKFRYARKVFMTPPWPELFRTDAERTHSYEVAIAEYETLGPVYERLGHEVIVLPKVAVKERVDFILRELGL